jgi:stage IV sporulation protein FB
MVRFTLFGVPVEIQPWFWLSAALLGGVTHANSPEELKHVLFFMFATTISILVHEFGHALTGRRLGGGRANIVLWAFGGLAYNQGGRFTKSGNFWMTAAGPGAGFIFFLLICLGLTLAFGPSDAWELAAVTLFGSRPALSLNALAFFTSHMPVYHLLQSFLWINFWWGVINLLPVLPLDGGRIAELFIRPQKRVHQVAIVAAGGMALYAALGMQSIYTTLLFGYLAYKNYMSLKEYHWQ